MKTNVEQFEGWLRQIENPDLEFKLASSNFDNKRGSLFDYCAAISNEDGGKLILGVLEKPREVRGTTFCQGTYNKLSHEIWKRIGIHVDVEEFFYKEARTLIFHIPRHPCGKRVKSGGKDDKFTYPIRMGESLAEMDDHKSREILNEVQPDFTSKVVDGLNITDLDAEAFHNLRHIWAEKKKRPEILEFSADKILDHLNLIENKKINYACLILLGKKSLLDKLLPNTEIIFEWRNTLEQIHHDFRQTWHEPYFKVHEVIWQVINSRNFRIPYQAGLFQKEVMAFDEQSIREAWLNAIAHRDYTIPGSSIFITANPKRMTIQSPGGLLPGITPENIIDKKDWRNRRLADALEKVGLIERSGQGIDYIFAQCIKDGKGMPNLSKSDSSSVVIEIPAQIQDKSFILFLSKTLNDKQISLDIHEIIELEKVRSTHKITNPIFKKKFLEAGIIQKVGKGRGIKYILSHQYYESVGQSGKHTRIEGLLRNQVKELILNHIRKGKPSRREDLLSGFPEYNPKDLSNILQELKKEGKLIFKGPRKGGIWHLSN